MKSSRRLAPAGWARSTARSDTKLGRAVAIKVLPDSFASDPDRIARFEREAKSLAALNHPHIAQIYGFETIATPESRVPNHVLVLMARWRGDGKELFFLDGATLQAVEVNGDGVAFESGTPHQLFNANLSMSPRYLYDVAPDGQRFLIVTNGTLQSALPITVVLNWRQPNTR